MSCWVHIRGCFSLGCLTPNFMLGFSKEDYRDLCRKIISAFMRKAIDPWFYHVYVKGDSDIGRKKEWEWAGEDTIEVWLSKLGLITDTTEAVKNNEFIQEFCGSEGSLIARIIPYDNASCVEKLLLCIVGNLRDRGETKEDTKEIAEAIVRQLKEVDKTGKSIAVCVGQGVCSVESEAGYCYVVLCSGDKYRIEEIDFQEE
ncbi:MAG TPA: hypothetical protein ENG66_01980 [Thermococcus sp.]|nr:hypothetical protein [Thermococcus sp.]